MGKILVAGSNGQVGQELQKLSSKFPHFEFVFGDVDILDITDHNAVRTFFEENKFNYVINCAAFTAVDKAETEVELAHRVNVNGVKNLADGCLKQDIPLVHISTDYVYHNDQNTPFKEGDVVNPQGVYAKTKLAGDDMALRTNAKTMILRTSWVYSTFGHNFVKTMLRLGKEKDQLGIVFDQIGTPTYAEDIADAILTILTKVENGEKEPLEISGVFHYSNEGVTSWYDFAKAIFEHENIQCDVNPIESYEYPTPAKRPPFSVLNKKKVKKHFGLKIPHWKDSLNTCLKALKSEVTN